MKAELQLALKSYPRGETSRAHVPQDDKRRQDLTCFIVGLICSSIREAPPTLLLFEGNQRWPRWPRRRAFSPVFARAARPLCAFPRLRATQNRPLRVALSHSRLLQNFGLTPPLLAHQPLLHFSPVCGPARNHAQDAAVVLRPLITVNRVSKATLTLCSCALSYVFLGFAVTLPLHCAIPLGNAGAPAGAQSVSPSTTRKTATTGTQTIDYNDNSCTSLKSTACFSKAR